MKTILVPIDFQRASEKAVRYIETVFKDQPVKVELLHVAPVDEHVPDGRYREEFKQFEASALKDYPLTYRFHLKHGQLLEEIQAAVTRYHASLVIVGTDGTALTKELVKLSDSPVLIVPEQSDKKKIRNIAYASDFKDISGSEALEPLMQLSKLFDAKVHIIHVNKGEEIEPDASEASLEYYLQRIDHEYASMNSDNFVTALEKYVSDQHIDVLTVLSRAHVKSKNPGEGKLIEELVSKAHIPVLSLA